MYSSEKNNISVKTSRGGEGGVELNKDYKVNNLKNKDISVVCSPFTYKYIVTRTKYVH
jgi:hypothetical protein